MLTILWYVFVAWVVVATLDKLLVRPLFDERPRTGGRPLPAGADGQRPAPIAMILGRTYIRLRRRFQR